MTKPLDPEDDSADAANLNGLHLEEFKIDDEDEDEDDSTICPDCGDPLDLVSGHCFNPACPLNNED